MDDELKMFRTLQAKYGKTNITAENCVNSFSDYKIGSDERHCIVNLACKLTYALWKQGKYDSMTQDEVAKIINAMQLKKYRH